MKLIALENSWKRKDSANFDENSTDEDAEGEVDEEPGMKVVTKQMKLKPLVKEVNLISNNPIII